MINVAIEAAKAAGRIIKQSFDAAHTITYKDENNIVSEIDTIAEQTILSLLKQEFPDHAFFSEEAGLSNNNSKYLWIIDPLDGTSNFTHHIPFCCVSIALFHQTKPLLGVVYDPLHEELYTAEVGKGAFLNEKPIYPSTTNELSKAMSALGRGSSKEAKDRHAQLYTAISAHTRTNRIIGSIALSIAYTACGKLDTAIINESNFYDCAAATIIARESGAHVTNFQGNALENETSGVHDILIAPPNLHAQLLNILAQ